MYQKYYGKNRGRHKAPNKLRHPILEYDDMACTNSLFDYFTHNSLLDM